MTDRHSYVWQEENPSAGEVSNIFETKSERIRRRLSLITINIVGFISTFGFSIVLTGAYPYLLQIDPEADKRVLGWVIAANPVGQLISSPIVGWLGNRFGSVRWLCMLTGVLNMIGFVLYACLGALPQPRRYWMIIARFIVGIAAGSVTLCITYISKATTSKERTTFISINALVSTIGFIVGPAVQSAMIPLGQEGVHLGIGELRWNMYTSAGWLAASLTLVSIILFLPCIFQEFNMAEKETKWNKIMNLRTEETQGLNSDASVDVVQPKSDMIGVFLCIFNFSVAGFILIMIETLATPISMDQLGYSDEEAVKKVGIVLSVGCILTILSFASSGPLARKITERKALVLCGLVPLLLCHVVLLPYAGPTPLMQQTSFNDSSSISLNQTNIGSDSSYDNESSDSNSAFNLNEIDIGRGAFSGDGSDAFSNFKETDFAKDPVALALRISEPGSNSTANLGCPVVQEWCRYTPAIHAEQLILGFMCIAIGYAFTATMSTSTMTQVLPPGQQGTWTGIYQAGGSLARILGPLYLTNVYTVYGPRATFGSIIVLLFLVIGLNLYLYKHLVPLAKRNPKT